MKKDNFEIIPKLKIPGRQVQTVVFSTDDAYVAPAGIAITSLLNTFSPDIFCDVVVLDNGISIGNRDKLQRLAEGSLRASIRFCDVTEIASDAPVRGYFSKATYFSLFVPYLFRTHEKILFLDCDLIVQADVSELFETVFDGEYIAAARDIGMAELVRGGAPMRFKNRKTSWRRYVARHFGIGVENIEQVVNTGVVLFNIPAFADDDFAALEEVMRHIYFGYFLVDQCVANILFKGRVKYLHLRWNLQVQHHGAPRLIDWFAQQYREASAAPAIIHYVTPRKPWCQLRVPYADAFWAVARSTVWFREMQESCLSESFMRWLRQPLDEAPVETADPPLFSIIMPVYNREDCVEQAIRSIRLQDFTGFELIVIDDASTDRTAEVVQKLAEVDPRIKLIRLETNQGPGCARNAGVAQAKGKYVGICDSDDFYAPGALSAFARQVCEQDFDVVAGNQYRWFTNRRIVQGDHGSSAIQRDIHASSLKELPEFWTLVHFHRCMIRREFLQENGIEYPALRRVEDPVYLADVLPKARSFALMQDPVYLFHVRPRSYELSAVEIRDAYTGYELIREKMTAAGYEEIAFFFHCFFSPLWLAHTGLTDEESLELAAKLIEILEPVPFEILDHPYMRHRQFDAAGFRHDLLVVKNSTPEQMVGLMRRGMFCGLEHLNQAEVYRLKQQIRQMRGPLQKLEPVLRAGRFGKKIFRRLQREIRPRFRLIARAARRRRVARFRAWKAMVDE